MRIFILAEKLRKRSDFTVKKGEDKPIEADE
jgi:hypothetical protein